MTEYRDHPLANVHAPEWAWGWGQDGHGVFVDIEIARVIQRMRWIYPGTFLMGSPDSEKERADWEWPRHRVTLTQGYWLADTPCTQELWEAVMGQNPSRFPSPQRPVEQVSWEDCQRFFEYVDASRSDLRLGLPTEAQWERACRAETEGATWLGDLEVRGHRDAPLLDSIAWYGGNSGVDFDLPDGYDSSDWKGKQYPHEKAGTRQVKLKKPNPWGLYDMLGNVYEWCGDGWESGKVYEGGERVDPVISGGPFRVYRGGSWGSYARRVRAAYRLGGVPGYRHRSLGFRLSRGPQV